MEREDTATAARIDALAATLSVQEARAGRLAFREAFGHIARQLVIARCELAEGSQGRAAADAALAGVEALAGIMDAQMARLESGAKERG